MLAGPVFALEVAPALVEPQAAGLELTVLAGLVFALEAESVLVEPQAAGFESELGKQVVVPVLGFVVEVSVVAELEPLAVS